MKTLGIFVNKNHINYIPFIAFLTSQIADRDNILLQIYDANTEIKNINLADINVFLNRYCFFDFDSILNDKNFDNNAYAVPQEFISPLMICPKSNVLGLEPNNPVIDVSHRVSTLDLYKCYLPNMNYINSSLAKSIFICYDDMATNFIDTLKEFLYKEKAVWFNNKTYVINPQIDLFKYKNTDVAKINKNTFVIWNNKTQEWKKFIKGDKILC